MTDLGMKPRSLMRGWVRPLLLWVLPVAVAGAGYWYYTAMQRYVTTDDAYIKAERSYISAEIPGNITRLAVHENQRVKTGQLLVELDTAAPQSAVNLAEAKLAAARTNIGALKKQYGFMAAALTVAEEQTKFARSELDRQRTLMARKMSSQSALDKADQMYELMRGGEVVLKEQMQGLLVRLAGNPDMPVEQHPEVQQAQVELGQAQLQLRRTRIHSPRDGIVNRVPFIGEHLNPGVPSMVVLSETVMWIEANFKETDLRFMRPGQPVEIEIDAYPNSRWRGTLHRIALATGSEFALLPPQNASGNWVKVVQRVPVRINIEPDPNAPPLRIGMSVYVKVDVGEHRSDAWTAEQRRGPP